MKPNTMFIERIGDEINLYGSYTEGINTPIYVLRSTKNQQDIGVGIFGPKYTNEYLIEKLKERPTHNFIGWLGGPLTMPTAMDNVFFVD